jgi:hypothetical protein
MHAELSQKSFAHPLFLRRANPRSGHEETARLLAPAFEKAYSKPGYRTSDLWFALGQLIGQQLIGTIDEVCTKVLDIERRGRPTCLLLAPVSPVFGEGKDDIACLPTRYYGTRGSRLSLQAVVILRGLIYR